MAAHYNIPDKNIPYTDNSSINLFYNTDYEEYPLHWHTSIEIIMPIENGYNLECNGVPYSLNEHDVMLITPGTLHHIHKKEGQRIIFQANLSTSAIFHDFDSFLSFIQPALVVTEDSFPGIHSKVVEHMNTILDEYNNNDPFKEVAIYSSLIQMLILIARAYSTSDEHFVDIKPGKQQEYVEKFTAICKYVNEHCTEELTLEDIAMKSGFSKYHFARLFKDFTNTSFHKYLNIRRIAYAENLLLDPGISITEAALRSGFNSISAFMRMFKIIKGCTPNEFRKTHQLTR